MVSLMTNIITVTSISIFSTTRGHVCVRNAIKVYLDFKKKKKLTKYPITSI